jgi:hypothetical protein
MASRCAWLGACASAGVASIAATESHGASFIARFDVLFIGQSFSVSGSRRFGRSKKFCSKNSNGAHHFRFRVPLQADCCYFHGVALNDVF